MNDNNLELLIHETSNVSERRQQDLSIFRQKFTKDDWDEVDRRYRAELEQKRKQEERIWRVQEVEEEWKHIVGEDGDEDKEEYERKVNTIGREKLWKVKEDHDEIKLKGKRFIRGTERLWTKCLFEVQAKKIKESCEAVNLDPVVAMIRIWYKETKKDQKSKLLIPSLQHQITKLIGVLMDEDCCENKCTLRNYHSCKYGSKDRMWIDGKDTLMHLVAEENMPILASQLIIRFPGQLNQRQKKGEKKLPVEIALKGYKDDVAAVIIKNMNNERVRMLFQPDKMTGETKLKFGDYIQRKDMKKSVIAILDCLMKPDWPFIDEEKKEDEQDGGWSKIADVPIRYHIYYRMLDGDPEGRTPSDKDFDYKAESNFKALLRSPNQEIIIRHPVVRLLADHKWDAFGEKWVRSFAVMYVFYLITLSIALLSSVTAKEPLTYRHSVDYFRMVCEFATLLASVVYLILEIDQMFVERRNYLLDMCNYLDLTGIALLFIIIPLRIESFTAQWGVAAAAYVINFLRLFKYAPAWPEMGLYSKFLARMLFKDGRQFGVIYTIIMLFFGGSIFLALKGTNQLTSVNGFGDIILREIRILTGGQAFSESYSTFNVGIVLLLLVNMLVVLVLLVNMFIAHLSNAYGDAQKEGKIRFSIDKAWMVSKLEQSHLKNFRKEFYEDGAYISDMEKLREILDDWDTLKAEENIGNLPSEAEKEEIRKFARKDRFYGVIL